MSNQVQIKGRIDKMIDSENSKTKAIASVTISDKYAVHGLRIVESNKGLFVSMPKRSFKKDGQTKYSDVFHALTSDGRNELFVAVLTAYEEKLDEMQQVYHGPSMSNM